MAEFLYYNASDIDMVIPSKPSPKYEPVIVSIPTDLHRIRIVKSNGNKIVADAHFRAIKLAISMSQEEVLSFLLSLFQLSLWINDTSSFYTVQLRFRSASEGKAEADEIISHIRALYHLVFPQLNIEFLSSGIDIQQEIVSASSNGQNSSGIIPAALRVGLIPSSRKDAFEFFYPHLTNSKGSASYGGFVKSYLSLCDYCKRPPNEELIWSIEQGLKHGRKLQLQTIGSLERYLFSF
jgi:hypothetical protein